MKIEFSEKIFEKYLYLKKMCSVGAELFLAGGGRTDGQTHEDSIAAFRNFAKAPRNR